MLTPEDRNALKWLMLEEPDEYVARIEAMFENAAEIIEQQIAIARARMAASPDKRPRRERDADLLPQPKQLDIELEKARMYVEQQMMLNAARTLGLREAETHLAAELAKMEQK